MCPLNAGLSMNMEREREREQDYGGRITFFMALLIGIDTGIGAGGEREWKNERKKAMGFEGCKKERDDIRNKVRERENEEKKRT